MDKTHSLDINDIKIFYTDIAIYVSHYLNLERYEDKYKNIFNTNKLNLLNKKYLDAFLESKINFYNEYMPNIIELYKELKNE